jgi:hypothetical protein
MTLARMFAAGLVACCAATTSAQPRDEWLVQAPLPDLVVGYRHEQGGSLIEERIPPGETVQDWSRMATTQRFAGTVARGITLETWAGGFFDDLRTGCPGYRGGEPRYFEADGRRTVTFRVDCPRNPATGKPETFLLRAIAGSADLHVVQMAYRRVPSPAEAQAAQHHLDSVRLCDHSSADPRCRP